MHDAGRALRQQHSGCGRARAAGIRLRQSDRTTARRPRPPGRLWRDAGESAALPPAISVEREYYVNDAGRQMDILAVSVWLRYLELCGEELAFPPTATAATTCGTIGAQLRDAQADARCSNARRRACCRAAARCARRGQGEVHRCADRAHARAAGRGGFRMSLKDLSLAAHAGATSARILPSSACTSIAGTSERALDATSGAIERALARLERAGAPVPQGRRAVVSRQRSSATRRPRGGARQRPEDLFRLRHRLSPAKARARLSRA